MSSRSVRGIVGGGSVVLAGVAMLAMTRCGGGPLAVALSGISFGTAGVMTTCAVTLIGEIAPARHRGLLLGLLTSVTAVILLVGGAAGIALINPERDLRRLYRTRVTSPEPAAATAR